MTKNMRTALVVLAATLGSVMTTPAFAKENEGTNNLGEFSAAVSALAGVAAIDSAMNPPASSKENAGINNVGQFNDEASALAGAAAQATSARSPTINMARPSTPAEAEAGRNNPDIISYTQSKADPTPNVPDAKSLRRIVIRNGQDVSTP